MRRFGEWIASALTRVSLWMYPPSFRREMGRQMEEDVRRRAGGFEGFPAPVKMVAWLVRLSGSLVANAVAAWREDRGAPSARRAVDSSGPFSWLDAKLGLRMLLRHPGQTVIFVVALSIGIPASLIPIHGFDAMVPPLPFDEGDRIVGIRNWNEGMYHPAAPGELYPIWMAIRLAEDPLAFVPRLRRITSEVDPEALVQFPQLLSDAPNIDKTVRLYSYMLLAFLCGVTLLLAGAGLYALLRIQPLEALNEG